MTHFCVVKCKWDSAGSFLGNILLMMKGCGHMSEIFLTLLDASLLPILRSGWVKM